MRGGTNALARQSLALPGRVARAAGGFCMSAAAAPPARRRRQHAAQTGRSENLIAAGVGGRGSWGLELGDDAFGGVDVVQGFEEGGAVDGDGAVHAGVEAVVAAQGLDVAVEDEADDLEVLVEDRGAGVAADDVVGGAHVEGRGRIQLAVVVGADPAFGQLEGIAAGGPLEGAADDGERGHVVAVLLVTLYRAVGEAEREGGVRVVALALDVELRRGYALGAADLE